ncbi:hypothetical protein BD410DRAFT_772254 [Rickenella mellea]|uniref:F-box domain-containing protein n=1 Tax=Rickenella mellea TaxID=50990 RepID=A0A4Y7PZL2_9AGAM|nr:hypothetical protein BD410DRAFT_772254 [Rickenella mellea]
MTMMDRVSFDDVLGTNYAPSNNERCSIKALVESMEEELSSLNQVLLPLLAKRDKLNDRILAHKTLLTPARRLLPELVSEIFTHTIPSESSQFYWGSNSGSHLLFPRPRISAAPLKLGRICRHWRQIALSSPSLWSAVDIPTNWGVEGLREWIRRAGSVTLSFNVNVHETNLDALNLLASYQKRWKDVMLYFDSSSDGRQFFQKYLDLLSRNYENLQTLDIQCTPPGWRETPIQPDIELTLGADSAPILCSLILNARKFKIIIPNTMPYLCLREINVGSDPIPTADLLAFLRHSPAVEDVNACVLYTPNSIDDIITLGNLKHLRISEIYDPAGQRLFPLEKLDLPALERLSLDVPFADDWTTPFTHTRGHQIRSLVYRSRPPLKALRIRGYGITTADIIYCTPFLRNLSCLDIEHVGISDNWDGVIQLLTAPSDGSLSGCMCPQLKEIRFGRGSHAAAPDLVIKMILSRNSVGNNKLSRVTVLSCLESDVLAHPKIKDCAENGLKFKGADDWQFGTRTE